VFDTDIRLTWKDDLDVLSVSERVEGLLGYKQADALTSISLQQLIHPRDLPLLHDLFSPATARRSGEVRLRIRGAGGRISCLRFSYVREWPVRDKIVVRGRLSDRRRKAGLSERSMRRRHEDLQRIRQANAFGLLAGACVHSGCMPQRPQDARLPSSTSGEPSIVERCDSNALPIHYSFPA
jgi:PAS domain-containing protein